MTAIHETACPRLKSKFSEHDIQDAYTTTPEDMTSVPVAKCRPRLCTKLGLWMRRICVG